MMLVDVHAHLNHEFFKDKLDEVIERARQAGVKRIICAGVNPPTNREVLELAEKYDIIRAALGAYPIDALNIQLPHLDEIGLKKTDNFDLDNELEFIKANKNKIIAIGEVGMDFKHLKSHEKQQRENFEKVISLAEDINKPIVVHSRAAELAVIEMLESSKLKKIVLHCFGGKKALIRRGAENGWSFSIPPVITRLQHFETVVNMVNINQLLTETDSPWLSPQKETRNEPANVIHSIKQIARLKSFDVEETANAIFMNYQKMFE